MNHRGFNPRHVRARMNGISWLDLWARLASLADARRAPLLFTAFVVMAISACAQLGMPERGRATQMVVQSCRETISDLLAADSIPDDVKEELRMVGTGGGLSLLPACERDDELAAIVSCEWTGSTCLIHVCDDVGCTTIPDWSTNICDCYEGLCWDQLPAPCA